MITAKQLKEKYEKDLEQLQKTCKHKKVSGWLSYGSIRVTTGDRVKQCEICWTFLQRKLTCGVCHKDYIVEEKDYVSYENHLCPECTKKGKYYCWTHKQFHDKPEGCNKCLEFLRQLEEIEKDS